LAVLGLLPEKIEMVVSGINSNANLGHDVTYSGTVTAAMEAAIWDLPAIAVSLDVPEDPPGVIDYGPSARIARQVVERISRQELPKNTLLNVNVPFLPGEEIKGIKITRQGLRVYRDLLVVRTDPRGRPYYWIGGDAPTGVPDEGTDFGALAEGYVSITPLHLDLTSYRVLEGLQRWEWVESRE
jgi:5'-nucleotidase